MQQFIKHQRLHVCVSVGRWLVESSRALQSSKWQLQLFDSVTHLFYILFFVFFYYFGCELPPLELMSRGLTFWLSHWIITNQGHVTWGKPVLSGLHVVVLMACGAQILAVFPHGLTYSNCTHLSRLWDIRQSISTPIQRKTFRAHNIFSVTPNNSIIMSFISNLVK